MATPITSGRRDQLAVRRASLGQQRNDLAALPAAADRDKALRQLDGLLREIDALIKPNPVKIAKPKIRRAGSNFDEIAEVARLTKDAKLEIRVSVKAWDGRRAVDIRQWCSVEGGTEWRPTGKGVFINAPLVEALIVALQGTLQHLPQT